MEMYVLYLEGRNEDGTFDRYHPNFSFSHAQHEAEKERLKDKDPEAQFVEESIAQARYVFDSPLVQKVQTGICSFLSANKGREFTGEDFSKISNDIESLCESAKEL